MPRDLAPPMVVTGLGMRCALGDHAAQCCAALRAGLSRFSDWKHLGLGGGGVPAACTRPALHDEPWTEKALGLLAPALAEALSQAQIYDVADRRRPGPEGRVKVLLGTPVAERSGVEKGSFEEFKETIAEDLFPDVDVTAEFYPADQAAGLVAVAGARRALAEDTADVCLVGSVDSLLESTYLYRLLEQGRLKARGASTGLIPGEGAAWLVVETARSARERGVRPLARLGPVGLAREARPWEPEAPVSTDALGQALEGALGPVGGAGAMSCVINDVNGERWRFLEWALAETRYLGALPDGHRLWHPAQSIGDVGAAFGAVAVCQGVRALERGYAGSGKVLVVAASERGERAALSISRAEGS